MYIKKVLQYDGISIKFDYEDLSIPVYFNPVDEEWKREKCRQMGFTYKGQTYFSKGIPLIQNDLRKNLYQVLSELICGDRNLHIKLRMQSLNVI